MRPIGPGRRSVPIHLYLIALLLLLFDVEYVFMLPRAVVLNQLGPFAPIEMGVFVLILVIGHVHAWKKGALEWE